MKLKLTLLIFISLFYGSELWSQVPVLTEREIVAELEKRGLEREDVEALLEEKGVDLNSLEDVTPEEMQIIQDVILELESGRGKSMNKSASELLDEMVEVDSLGVDSLQLEPIVFNEEEDYPEPEIYGQGLFRQDLIKEYPKEGIIRASNNYVLGSGDELSISIYGPSQLDKQFTIGSDGYIRVIDGAKRIYLQGLNLEEAGKKIEATFAQYYSFSKGDLNVSLAQSRTVTISIYGEVFVPGPVTIPAINNAFSAIARSKGPTNLGSVRNIELLKSNGKRIALDVYKYMNDPQYSAEIYLDDNDIILVPVAENIVEISGAVKRPMKYEIRGQEDIQDLIKYAGGVNQNALLRTIRVMRYQNDERIITDVDLREIQNGRAKFPLVKGDFISVDTIVSTAVNFVEVQGELYNPGIFARSENMRLSDALLQAGLKESSRTDIAFLKRRNQDGSIEFEELNIDLIIANPGSAADVLLQDQDLLTVWAKQRFVDEATIAVDGAVRFPDNFEYDVSKKVKLREAIILSGGLRRDASQYATVFRKDPLNPKVIEYVTVSNVPAIVADPNSSENIELNPFDSIYIHSDNTFLEESFVSIYGAVNNPGTFQFGKEMNIEDLIVLAGGFKISAATNNVEVSRVIIKDNQPTNVVIAKLEIDKTNYKARGFENGYEMAPFDRVAVRYVPEFELQESVILKGEVTSPGAYAIVGENEKISSIINRAGGLTNEAFPEGASLLRAEDDLGAIVVKLNDIFLNPDSRFDFIVRGGDTITIPKRRQFVTIKGATNVREVLSSESINSGNEIHVPYHRGKNALFYVNQYAGGFNKDANKRSLVVRHPNGEVKKLQGFVFFNKYPEVKEGSVISISFRTTEEDDKTGRDRVDWSQILKDYVGQAISILTVLIALGRF